MTDAAPVSEPYSDVIDRYVIDAAHPPKARYMNLLHGRFLRSPADQQTRFVDKLRRDARQISDEDLASLLDRGLHNWRPWLTAAWLAGLDRRTKFRHVIADLLLASEVCYSGQGYCFALAAFGAPEDAGILVSYLVHYLPQVDLRYDQHWALGALAHLDSQLGTDHAGPILSRDGLWGPWSTRLRGLVVDYTPYKQLIAHACSL